MHPYPLLLACYVILLSVGCKKEEEPTPEPTPAPATPAYKTSFTATRSFVDLGNGNTSNTVLAAASVQTYGGTPTAVDSVVVNGIQAVQAIIGYYVVEGSMGLDLSIENLTWRIGDQATGMAFEQSLSDMTYPAVSPITSATVIPNGGGYTFTCSGVSGADSVVFVLGPLQKRFAGNVASCTFSAAEIAGLATELYQGTITALRSRTTTVGDVRCRSAKADARAQMILVE